MYHTQILQRRQRCLTCITHITSHVLHTSHHMSCNGGNDVSHVAHTLILKRWQRCLTIMTLYHTLAAAATVAYHIFAAAANPSEREPATRTPASQSRCRRANPNLCPGSFHLATVLTADASIERQRQRNQSTVSRDVCLFSLQPASTSAAPASAESPGSVVTFGKPAASREYLCAGIDLTVAETLQLQSLHMPRVCGC